MAKHLPSTRRFGKHPAVHDYRTLRFRDYVTATLPAPPASFAALPRVFDNLGTSDVSKLFPMDGNDTVGDCTIAALAHAVTLFHGFVNKKPSIMPTARVLKLYYRLIGGVDSGLAELNVLKCPATRSSPTSASIPRIMCTCNRPPRSLAVCTWDSVDSRAVHEGRARGIGGGLRRELFDDAHLGKHAARNLGVVGRMRRRGVRDCAIGGEDARVRTRLQRATVAGGLE